jgi:hypothetical protein
VARETGLDFVACLAFSETMPESEAWHRMYPEALQTVVVRFWSLLR